MYFSQFSLSLSYIYYINRENLLYILYFFGLWSTKQRNMATHTYDTTDIYTNTNTSFPKRNTEKRDLIVFTGIVRVMPYHCDVCGILDELAGNGGGAMRESDGTHTIVCQECVDIYCLVDQQTRDDLFGKCGTTTQIFQGLVDGISSDNPDQRNYFRYVANRESVGTDSEAVSDMVSFSKELPFDQQALAYFAIVRNVTGKRGESFVYMSYKQRHHRTDVLRTDVETYVSILYFIFCMYYCNKTTTITTEELHGYAFR